MTWSQRKNSVSATTTKPQRTFKNKFIKWKNLLKKYTIGFPASETLNLASDLIIFHKYTAILLVKIKTLTN